MPDRTCCEIGRRAQRALERAEAEILAGSPDVESLFASVLLAHDQLVVCDRMHANA